MRLQDYYREVWARKQEMNDGDIFQELPTYIRYEVAAHILQNDLSGLDFFAELADTQRHLLATRMTPMEVLPDNELAR